MSKPSEDFFSYVTMFYGAKKIGKTSLANMLSSNTFHMMIEPMARALKMYQKPCPTYEHVTGYIDLIEQNPDKYETVSVDPLPLFYNKAMDYTCKKYGFDHPSDLNDFGASWNKVRHEFERPLLKLLHLPVGCIFHAHENEEELENRFGTKYKRMRPDGGKQVNDFIDANIENIFYYHMRGNKRFLQIRGDENAFAACAHTDKFYTPDGEQISAIPMGKSAEEGYKNLLKAFNNQQKETYAIEEEEDETEKPIKRKKKKKRKI